jgi:hypothetical protein
MTNQDKITAFKNLYNGKKYEPKSIQNTTRNASY